MQPREGRLSSLRGPRSSGTRGVAASELSRSLLPTWLPHVKLDLPFALAAAAAAAGISFSFGPLLPPSWPLSCFFGFRVSSWTWRPHSSPRLRVRSCGLDAPPPVSEWFGEWRFSSSKFHPGKGGNEGRRGDGGR